MTAELMADVVGTYGDWDHREEVGPDIALLFYRDGTVRFEHVCDRGRRGVIRCAPELSPGHDVRTYRQQGPRQAKRLPGRTTVSPSILCEDCGTHGFVTNGVWTS